MPVFSLLGTMGVAPSRGISHRLAHRGPRKEQEVRGRRSERAALLCHPEERRTCPRTVAAVGCRAGPGTAPAGHSMLVHSRWVTGGARRMRVVRSQILPPSGWRSAGSLSMAGWGQRRFRTWHNPRMSGAPADRIFFGGDVVTVDARDTLAEAVAVRDGRIAAVGRRDDLMALAGPSTASTTSAGGRCCPGLSMLTGTSR